MARSREHVFSGLWSRDRGCYWWVSEVIAGRVGASRLFAAYVVSIHDAFRCIDGSVAYDLALVFLLLRPNCLMHLIACRCVISVQMILSFSM